MQLKKDLLKNTLIPLILLIAVIFAGAVKDHDFEISKNLDIFATLFKQLNSNYAEEINPGALTKEAIDAMLSSLDPYTVYIPEAHVEDYRYMTAAQLGGVGMTIRKRDDHFEVYELIEDAPAHKAGIIIGDIILDIDGHMLTGKSENDVNTLINGQSGTSISFTMKNPVSEKIYTKKIARVDIKPGNIPYYDMLSNDIAYIKLNSFTQTASADIKKSWLTLREKHSLNGLIIDLRGNGGGLLMEAVKIVNFFVNQNEPVVSTRGRIAKRNITYQTTASPIDLSVPLIILIDRKSASASEIVAGALQDLDRAVVIGQPSFGKGLVQNIVPLTYNAQLKVTVAKYYIPSGRCIQAIEYFKNNQHNQPPDSLLKKYTTRNQRPVYEGRGIAPDIEVEKPPMSNIASALTEQHLLFDFATLFRNNNTAIDPPDKFSINQHIWNDFLLFIKQKDYSYQTKTEKLLSQITETAKEEAYYNLIKPQIEHLNNAVATEKANDIERHKEEIQNLLLKEIVYRYYYEKGHIIATLSHEKEIDESIKIILNSTTTMSLLAGGYTSK
ncbi:MAG: S41 family peptidase [Bacteroidales bacterium]|nr:S41 family peptidase [Bacteroidales bacterium]